MNETIDPSEWLHQSVEKAYPDLMKRLGAIEHNGRITCASRFGFDQLYRYPENSPIFDSSHLSAAEFITVLNEVAFRRCGYTRLKELIVDLTHGGEIALGDPYCPQKLWVAIMRDLDKPQEAMIKRICFEELRTNDIGWIMLNAEFIRLCFAELGKAIEKALDTMRELTENKPITRPYVSLKFPEPV